MNSIYGSTNNKNKFPLIFDKIYESKEVMDASAATDGVFYNRLVYLDKGDNIKDSYNHTIWQKIRSGNEDAYQLVGSLDAHTTVPTFKIYPGIPNVTGEVLEAYNLFGDPNSSTDVGAYGIVIPEPYQIAEVNIDYQNITNPDGDPLSSIYPFQLRDDAEDESVSLDETTIDPDKTYYQYDYDEKELIEVTGKIPAKAITFNFSHIAQMVSDIYDLIYPRGTMEVLNSAAFNAINNFSELVIGTSGFLIPQYYQFDNENKRYIPILQKPTEFQENIFYKINPQPSGESRIVLAPDSASLTEMLMAYYGKQVSQSDWNEEDDTSVTYINNKPIIIDSGDVETYWEQVKAIVSA